MSLSPRLRTRLEQQSLRYEEVSATLADAETIADRARFTALSREHAELHELVELFARYRSSEAELTEAMELLGDDDAEMRAMARDDSARIEGERDVLAAELQEKFEMKFITPTDQLALIDARRAGRQEGRQEGIEIGVRRGQLRELRESILEIAEARLGPCSSEWVERIQSIESIEMLTALRRQVLRAETWSEVSLP